MMKRQGHSRGQRFVKADYYELDWYYDECTDGKTTVCASEVRMQLKIVEEVTQTINSSSNRLVLCWKGSN